MTRHDLLKPLGSWAIPSFMQDYNITSLPQI